jgi:glycerol uptake facilitator-like aquaporin
MNARPIVAEFVGTGLLAYVVVGSGITVESFGAEGAGGLFFHAVAVGLALAVLIALLGSTSGAHFNPAVTVAFWRRRHLDAGAAVGYFVAQIVGATAGVAVGVATFGDTLAISTTERGGWGPVLAEGIGTLILALLILGLVDEERSHAVAPLAGAWVAAAVFATVSTGFLNPALTVARMFTDTYTGIAPSSVPGFVLAQLIGGLLAVLMSTHLLVPAQPKGA